MPGLTNPISTGNTWPCPPLPASKKCVMPYFATISRTFFCRSVACGLTATGSWSVQMSTLSGS